MMFDGVLNQFGIRFQTEGLHNSVFVEGYCTWFHVQDTGNLLHRHAFRKQLQNLTLAASDPFFRNIGLTASQEEAHRFFRNEWRKVRLRLQSASNGYDQLGRCRSL